ncbi:hypothetical protein IE53DRAFT_172137 [Violaceomyces palustris]|uniref:Uncharacterized protein n=1 Tax=Violaceomyces palustris TaxID=1673888 RepID=A0ACD0NSX0_9BASI|nr:hypothetical protein IE53DRAFT_172137 [Violaceomyces palustris]
MVVTPSMRASPLLNTLLSLDGTLPVRFFLQPQDSTPVIDLHQSVFDSGFWSILLDHLHNLPQDQAALILSIRFPQLICFQKVLAESAFSKLSAFWSSILSDIELCSWAPSYRGKNGLKKPSHSHQVSRPGLPASTLMASIPSIFESMLGQRRQSSTFSLMLSARLMHPLVDSSRLRGLRGLLVSHQPMLPVVIVPSSRGIFQLVLALSHILWIQLENFAAKGPTKEACVGSA